MRMIIFGIGAHLAEIGGVENSVRALISCVPSNIPVKVVCRAAAEEEKISVPLCETDVELIEYRRSTLGISLRRIYRRLYADDPTAIVICRHHIHALAAKKVGFNVRYLVPSIIQNQVDREVTGLSTTLRIRSKLFSLLHTHLQRQALLSSDKVYVFSSTMKSQILEVTSGRICDDDIHEVRPGIDFARFRQRPDIEQASIRNRYGLPVNKRLSLFIGRLVKAKGLEVAIRAFAHLDDEHVLVLAGSGALLPELIALVKKNNLENRVHFLGSTSTVEELYACCDVFLMTSSYEPLGQTILEAAATGMPIVAYTRSGRIDTATEELGLESMVTYVDDPEPEKLAEGIHKASRLPRFDKNFLSKIKFTERFSWKTLYNSLCD